MTKVYTMITTPDSVWHSIDTEIPKTSIRCEFLTKSGKMLKGIYNYMQNYSYLTVNNTPITFIDIVSWRFDPNIDFNWYSK